MKKLKLSVFLFLICFMQIGVAAIFRPTAPTGLTAVAVSPTQIDLSWQASRPLNTISSYKVYKNGSLVRTSSLTSYSSGGLSPKTSYSYYIIAVDKYGRSSLKSPTVTTTTLADVVTPPPPPPSDVIGYLGCSMTQAIVYGLENLNSSLAWLPVPQTYGGRGIKQWSQDFNDSAWKSFEAALAAQPTKVILWQLCALENSKSSETYANALKVVNHIRELIPGVELYVSAQPTYSPSSHVCSIAGSTGPSRMASIAAQLVENEEVFAGPVFGPLSSSTQLISDGCHPNFDGENLLGNQFIDFFTSSAPPPDGTIVDLVTEVLAQSQTTQVGSKFNFPNWQFRVKTGSGYMNWMNSTDSIWSNPEQLYTSDGTAVKPYSSIERVVLTIGKAPSDVGLTGTYESLVAQTIATIRTKYPNLKEIRLQPLAAGPNKTICVSGGKNVLTTVNLPAIEKAIQSLTSGSSDVKASLSPLVDNCNEFVDSTGHLSDPIGREDIARKIEAFYTVETPVVTFSGSKGLYVVDDGATDYYTALSSPLVDGTLVRGRWAQMESSEGKYNFSSICGKITSAETLKKSISLVNYTFPPTWLYNKVPASERWTHPTFGASIVPWSKIGQDAMKKFLEAEANFVCGKTTIKSNPFLKQVNTGILGMLDLRDAPTYTMDVITPAILESVKMTHVAFSVPEDKKDYYNGVFPLGRVTNAVENSIVVWKEIEKAYPFQHSFVENWGIAGPKGTYASPFLTGKYKIAQACGYFSSSKIKCSDTGRADNLPKLAFDAILKPAGVTSVQLYPADILYPGFKADIEYIHEQVNK